MHTILLVDDNKEFLLMVEDVLSMEGYNVLTAARVQEAIQILDSNVSIDILITDMRMPDDSLAGLTLLKKVQEKSLPIVCIIMSGYPNIRDYKGFHAYMEKPIRSIAMLNIIDSLLKEKQHS